MHKPAHYILLFLIIVLGVALGNLLSNIATAKYVAHQTEKALHLSNQAAKEEMQRLRNERAEQQRQVQRQVREQRIQSTQGRQLHRACLDWEQAYQQFKSEVSLSKMQAACRKYERYIDTGRIN